MRGHGRGTQSDMAWGHGGGGCGNVARGHRDTLGQCGIGTHRTVWGHGRGTQGCGREGMGTGYTGPRQGLGIATTDVAGRAAGGHREGMGQAGHSREGVGTWGHGGANGHVPLGCVPGAAPRGGAGTDGAPGRGEEHPGVPAAAPAPAHGRAPALGRPSPQRLPPLLPVPPGELLSCALSPDFVLFCGPSCPCGVTRGRLRASPSHPSWGHWLSPRTPSPRHLVLSHVPRCPCPPPLCPPMTLPHPQPPPPCPRLSQ